MRVHAWRRARSGGAPPVGENTSVLYLITTVPVPVKVKGPKMNVIAPVDASAVIDTGVPISAALLDCVTNPVRVMTVPVIEPVSGK